MTNLSFTKIYQKIFTNQKVGRQLLTIYTCALLIPILLLGTAIFFFSGRTLVESYHYQTEEDALRVRSIIMTTTLYLYNIYDSIEQDSTLNEILSLEYSSDAEALKTCLGYTQFEDIEAKNASLSGVKLYIQPEMLHGISDSRFFYQIDDNIRNTDWYSRICNTRSGFWKSDIRTDSHNHQQWELHYYSRIPVPQSSSYAILVLSVSNDYLRNLINDKNSLVYLSVNDDSVFYSTNRSDVGIDFPIPEALTSFYSYTGKLSLFDNTVIGSVLTLTPYQSSDQIQILSADTNALPYLHRVYLSFGGILIFALLISLIIILLFSGFFSARIQTLRLAMHKVSQNDYEIVDSFWGDDELSATFTDLKTMVEKIKATEAKVYEARIKEQDFSNQQQQMELKLLSSQINPHFLYNTLETIRMKAFAEGNREVANAIKLLGKSMRYTLGNSKTTAITLDKELDHAITYMSIQQLRFGSRLTYHIKVANDIELSQYQVIPLLIQPIVENAISHGLEVTGENGHLILHIHRLSDVKLSIDVFDNGAGITKERLEYVKEHLVIAPDKMSDHGIGLYNINNRIKLFYGEEYGLQISSRLGVGTLVTITLPLYNLMEEAL